MAEDPGQERRSFTRIHFDADTRLRAGEQEWEVQLRDISLKGLLVSVPNNWPEQAPARLVATLALDAENSIVMHVTPTHQQGGHLGLRCEHIDLDSISHLRRLVELNTGDSSLLDRELSVLSLSHQGADEAPTASADPGNTENSKPGS